MDILFCDRCHESIPDADLESGKAVRIGGRVLHVPCALRTAMPGPGRTVAVVFAVLAAAGAAYAIARAESAVDRPLPEEMPRAWRAPVVDESAGRASHDIEAALASERKELIAELNAILAKAAEGIESGLRSEIRQQIAKIEGQVSGFTQGQLSRFESNEKSLAEVRQWVKEVREIASRPPPTTEANVSPPPNGPAMGGPDAANNPPFPPAPTPSAGTPPPDPEAQRRHDQELEKWIKDLKDPNNGIAFTATYKLKDLKDLRAVPALVETLQKHRDYYTRLGAAVALGELKSCDAVPALLDAFDDKEDLVQQAAAEAFTTITGFDLRFAVAATRKERKAIREQCSRWWKEHEPEVRLRLGQPLK